MQMLFLDNNGLIIMEGKVNNLPYKFFSYACANINYPTVVSSYDGIFRYTFQCSFFFFFFFFLSQSFV